MRSDKLAARVAGTLFIAATAASLLSTGLLNPILNSSDYLVRIFGDQDRVIAGALFEIVAGCASAGIAISLYPVLKSRGNGLALGSVAFRVMEGVLYLIGAVAVLLLVSLSQAFSGARDPASSSFQVAGSLLRDLRDQTSLAGVIAFYVGATMYYWLFYRSQLIPRWLSGWGLAGTALGLVAALLVLFQATGYMSTVQVVLNLPIGVNEMVLAVWLIVRGFPSTGSSPPIDAGRRPVGVGTSATSLV
ncbi:MAG: DUF4386 domain-containing protein [Acidimicrobiales bacterium]|jgi:hypothetical protein